ncbi:hypothetical protein ACFQ8T_10395 [Isoptericola sp. NPDC056618]|uniref:hypothetical protein n=1 Tax=Isoptericola sp. NPDC056618 TaxID=3345878 RepID=UPI003692D810
MHTLTAAFRPTGSATYAATASKEFTSRYAVTSFGPLTVAHWSEDPSRVTISGQLKTEAPSTSAGLGSVLSLAGTVTLRRGDVVVGSAPVAADGKFVLQRMPVAAGQDLTVAYAEGFDYGPATRVATFADRRRAVTLTNVVVRGPRADAGITATVHTQGDALFAGAGRSVALRVDGRQVATLPLEPDAFQQTAPAFTQRLEWEHLPIPAGRHTVTLDYTGNTNYAPTSTSTTTNLARSKPVFSTDGLVSEKVLPGWDPPVLAYGKRLTLTARLSDEGTWTPSEGARVQFQARTSGSTTWRALATVASSGGVAKTSVTHQVSASYRAVVVADSQYEAASGARTEVIKARRSVSLSMTSSPTSPRTTKVLTAKAGPRGTFVLQKYTRGAWRTTAQKTPAGSATSIGTARFTVTRGAAAVRWRVVVKADATGTRAQSASVVVPRR